MFVCHGTTAAAKKPSREHPVANPISGTRNTSTHVIALPSPSRPASTRTQIALVGCLEFIKCIERDCRPASPKRLNPFASGNEFGDDCWIRIAASLLGLPALDTLNGHKGFGPVRRGGLVELDLAGVGRDLVLATAPLWPRSAGTLTSLDLSKNLVGPCVASHIAENLATLSNLVTLNLICNGLGSGVRVVYDAVVGIQTLKDVKLGGNGVGPKDKLDMVLAPEARHIQFWC